MTVSSKTTPTPAPTQLIIRGKSTLSVGLYRGSDSSDTVVSVVQGCKSGEVIGGGVLGLHKISLHEITEICQFGCFRVLKISTLQHRMPVVLSIFSFCPHIS